MRNKSLQREHLNLKMQEFALLQQVQVPATGWIKAIRMALGMSMQQLGNQLSITIQSIYDIEKRERDGSLYPLIEKRAAELAKTIVQRTSNTMKLEAQENSQERVEKAIQERTDSLIREMPGILWD